MKNFQHNLLLVLSLGLCALCAWQWYIQTLLHNEGDALQKTIFQQSAGIQAYTNSIKDMDAEIAGLSTRINELTKSAMSNEQVAAGQKREILRLRLTGAGLSNEIIQYKDVADKLEGRLKEAAEGIQKQNDAIKQLVLQRDDAIKRFNDSIKDRNALAEKYNDLVERFNKLQAAATNAPKP